MAYFKSLTEAAILALVPTELDAWIAATASDTGRNWEYDRPAAIWRYVGDRAVGRLISVDALVGSDASGRRNGFPFATIAAALAVAVSGDVVLVGPGTYTQPAGITIPAGVTLQGFTPSSVTLQALGVTVATDLITMGENSAVRNLIGNITCTNHSQIRGFVFPGTTTATARVESCIVTVDETGASAAGTSNAYGAHVTGAGSNPIPTVEAFVLQCQLTVKGAGLGSKRGVLVDVASGLNIGRMNILMVQTDAALASYFGVETNNAAASVNIQIGIIDSGGPQVLAGQIRSDISATLGLIQPGFVNLANSSANEKSLLTLLRTTIIVWGDMGVLPNGLNFMRFGTATSTANEAKIRMHKKSLIYSLSVKTFLAPGGAVTDTFTIRKNGVDTNLVASLTGAATSVANDNVAISFQANDELSLKVVKGVGSLTSDAQVTVQSY